MRTFHSVITASEFCLRVNVGVRMKGRSSALSFVSLCLCSQLELIMSVRVLRPKNVCVSATPYMCLEYALNVTVCMHVCTSTYVCEHVCE